MRLSGLNNTFVAVVLSVALTACGGVASGSAVTPTPGRPTTTESGLACHGPTTARSTPSVTPITDDPDPQLPVTVSDLTGRSVTVTDASRILALDSYGTLASTVYALGLGDRLVGRDISTGIREIADLPLVTHDGHELNGEAILDLEPTVILTDYSIGPLEVQLQLMDSGIPVLIMSDQRSRDQIAPQIEAVARALGVPEAGTALAARVGAEIEEAETRIADLVPANPGERLRMVFLYVRGNAGVYYWFGEGSGADDLIESLGGLDVSAEVGLEGMRPVNAEGLVKAAPDMFLMMTLGLESVGGVEGLLAVPGVAETPAGAASCVVDMSDYQILAFGPQFPSTIESLGRAVYEEAVAR